MNKSFNFNDPTIKIGAETTWMLKHPIVIKSKTITTTTQNNKTTTKTRVTTKKIGDKVTKLLIKNVRHLLLSNNIKYYNVYNDCNVIEICSPPLLLNDFKKWYNSLHKLMRKNGYIESSVYNLYDQGGLHLNIDTPSNTRYGMYDDKETIKSFNVLTKFTTNLQAFYNNNPWINWMFYEPNEDSQSKNRENITKRSIFSNKMYVASIGGREFCYRCENEKIEFRGYSMPLNKTQFNKYVNFTVLLYNYLSNPNTSIVTNSFDYSKITLSQAKANIKKVCTLIGYPKEWLDFTNLELRYSYDDYKTRLI